MHADDGHTPALFRREVVYEDEFVCVVANNGSYKQPRITLKQYVKAPHASVGFQIAAETPVKQRDL